MRIKIQQKIALIFSLITLVILAGIFVYLQFQLKKYTYQRIHTHLSQEIQLARSFLLEAMDDEMSISSVDPVVDRISEDLAMRVTVIQQDGVVLGDSQLDPEDVSSMDNHLYRPEVQQAIREDIGSSQRFSNTIQQNLLYLAIPYDSLNNKGFIRLAFPLSEVEAIMQRLKEAHMIAFLMAFILMVVLGYLASNIITKPILEISKAAKAIAAGNFSHSLHIHTGDEIEELAQSINFMSEQIKARIGEALASKSRMETVLLSMFEGVMVIDAEGYIVLVNSSLKELLHVDDGILKRKPIEAIRNLDIQDLVDRVLEKKKTVESKEISILMPEEKSLLIHAARVEREEEIYGAVLVFHDITELRKLENIRKDFVANVSHELRTPITSIKGYAETLLGGAKDDPKHAQEFLNIIYAESDRLAKLVEDILDLSKIESGKIDFDFQPCAVAFAVKRVLSGLKNQIKSKRIAVDVQISEESLKVQADEAALSQIFLNLIENAIKYNRDKGSLTISVVECGPMIQISIKDTGLGIPKNDLERIFERFYRVDKAHSREMGGTGLGLSIVKHLVNAHQGEVAVESLEGQGTTVSFKLPKA